MSEIKFSCPQCGQHIACDTGLGGRQTSCPSCQAAIEIPANQSRRRWVIYAYPALVLLGLTAAGIVWLSEARPYCGKTRKFNSTQLTYWRPVTDAEAEKLGKFLDERRLADLKPKSARLRKVKDTYQLSFPVREAMAETKALESAAKRVALELSYEVFSDAPVVMHFCDSRFKTVNVVQVSQSQLQRYLAEKHARRAFELRQSGAVEQAFAEAKRAVALDTNYPNAQLLLGDISLIDRGELDEAIQAYGEVKRLAPNFNPAMIDNNLAWAYVLKGVNLPKAIELAQHAVALNPLATVYLHTLGSANLKAGRNRQALEVFQKLLQIQEDYGVWPAISEIAKSDIDEEFFMKFCLRMEVFAPPLEMKLVSADFYRARGESAKAAQSLAEAQKEYARRGYPNETNWLVIGPFDNVGDRGLSIAFPPEQQIGFSASYPGKDGAANWKEADDGRMDGRLDFSRLFSKHSWTVAYALIEVVSPEERNVQLRVGSDDGVKVWLNDSVIWTAPAQRGFRFDQDILAAKLRQGPNRLLCKVSQGSGEWQRAIRVTDATGKLFEDLEYRRPAEFPGKGRNNPRTKTQLP